MNKEDRLNLNRLFKKLHKTNRKEYDILAYIAFELHKIKRRYSDSKDKIKELVEFLKKIDNKDKRKLFLIVDPKLYEAQNWFYNEREKYDKQR